MSNRQLSLTIKANDILDEIPKRLRSKFASDAIVNYAKKKGVMDDYLTSRSETHKENTLVLQDQNPKTKSDDEVDKITKNSKDKKKVNIDSGY